MSLETEEEKCLLCLDSRTNSLSLVLPAFPRTTTTPEVGEHFLWSKAVTEGNDDQDQSSCLSSHLWSIFLLRKFLQFPEKECRSLFQKTFGGVHPGSWFSLCEQCSEIVQNACQLHFQISKLQKQMELLREETFEKLKGSFMNVGEDARRSPIYLNVDGLIREYYRRLFAKDIGSRRGTHADDSPAVEHFGDALISEHAVPFNEQGSEQEHNEDSSDSDFVVDEDESGASLVSASPVESDVEEDEDSTINTMTKAYRSTPGSSEDEVEASPTDMESDDDVNKDNETEDVTSSTLPASKKPSIKLTIKAGGTKIGENSFKCRLCEEIIEGKRKFQDHMQAHRLTCDRCGYKNRRTDKFAIHMRSHKINDNILPPSTDAEEKDGKGDKATQYSCKLCDDFSGHRTTVYRHISNVHFAEELIPCPLCPKRFTQRNHVKMHVQTVHDIHGDFPCPSCNQWCLTPESLKEHMKTHESGERKKKKRKPVMKPLPGEDDPFDDGNMYICAKCDETIEGTKAFQIHKTNHRNTCDRCGYHSKRYEKVLRHIRSHEINDKIIDLGPQSTSMSTKFSCKLCDFLGNRQTVYSHISKTHFAKTSLVCEICSKTFACRGTLRDHVRTSHEKKCCDQCPARFSTKQDFDDHMQWHENGGQSSIICEKCGKGFSTRTTLEVHLRKTVTCGLRVRVRPVGPKSKVNRIIKEKEKPAERNKCRFCEETRFNQFAMNAHLREAHRDKFTYKCELCEDGLYMCHKALKSHKERAHSQAKFDCPKGCGYVSYDSRKLTRHLSMELCGKNERRRKKN